MNVGRLRIASKALDRNPNPEAPAEERLVDVAEDDQWERGLYMIGQVAALRDTVVPMADLHAEVAAGAKELLAVPAPVTVREDPTPPPADIAIVGMASVFPGSPDYDTLFDNVLAEADLISEVPEERWSVDLYHDPNMFAPDKTYGKAGGFIDEVAFDPVEFLMPPTVMKSIEPFQILALLTAKKALDDAGYGSRPFNRERASVILGAGGGGGDVANDLVARAAFPQLFGEVGLELAQAMGDRLPDWTPDTFPGMLMNVAAGRIANRLDFGGANYTTDAACASSIAAISNGVRDLQTGATDLVLSGGVDCMLHAFSFLCFSKTPALSPTGHSRPFDAEADGIAIGEGVGMLVLKRLADAERDGDKIYAVIKGVGASSDGKGKGLTAPRPGGQMRALRRAYEQAGFSPSTVDLFEAHGTGTVVGDKAELESLSTVLMADGAEPRSGAVGSIKSNMGHAKIAAGAASMVKTVLALHHKVLPPTIGVSNHNPTLVERDFPLYANTVARPWVHTAEHPRRAGVSAFGFGGTNFHVALEEYVDPIVTKEQAPVRTWPTELLTWAAPTAGDLKASVSRTAAAAAKPHATVLGLAKDLASRKRPAGAPHRAAVVAGSIDELREQLSALVDFIDSGQPSLHRKGIHYTPAPSVLGTGADGADGTTEPGKVAFLFSGQGSQKVDMGRELAVAFPAVRERFETADRVFADREVPLSRLILAPPAPSKDEAAEQTAALTQTDNAQPALGVIESAQLDLVRATGLIPDMVAGHSYGEIMALLAAGSIDLPSMLRLSAARGRVVATEVGDEPGTMCAVSGGRDDVAELLEGGTVVLANHNSPDQIVLAGGEAEIEAAIAWCGERKLAATKLPVACAFHSPFLTSAGEVLGRTATEFSFAAPSIPVYSNTTAAPLDVEPEAMPAHLAGHLVQPVEFDSQIRRMHDDGARLFIEIGPRSVLTNLTRKILSDREHVVVSVDKDRTHGVTQLQTALAVAMAEGRDLDLSPLFTGRTPVAPPPKPSPTTFMVNGARARHHAEDPFIPSQFSLGAFMSDKIPSPDTPQIAEAASTNGSHTPVPAAEAAPAPAAPVPAEPAPAVAPAPAAASAAPGPVAEEVLYPSETGFVMDQYHQVISQIVEAERSVIMAYLGQSPGEAPQARRGAIPAPSRRVINRPAAAPAPARPAQGAPAVPQPAAPAPVPAAPANGNGNGLGGHGVDANGTNGAEANGANGVDANGTNGADANGSNGAGNANPLAALVPGMEGEARDPNRPRLSPEDIEDMEGLILDVVADRTGYPKEMLDLDADMEADLGIDSIKKVEIAGTMLEILDLDLADIDQEGMIGATTLRMAMDVLESSLANAAAGGSGQDVPFEEPTIEETVEEV
jgi:acyl transferase domain-containing protein